MLDKVKKRSYIKRFIGLSALLHLNLLLLAVAFFSFNPDGCATSNLAIEPFEVALVSEEEIIRPKEKDPDLEKLKEEEKKRQEEEKNLKGQVVDLPRPREEKQPDKAQYLSQYDSKVAKETKSRPTRTRPGRLTADRPLKRPRTPPPTPREQQRLQEKLAKLAMRTKPALPQSRFPKADKGDRPAQVEPRPHKTPQGPLSPQKEAAGPRQKINLQDLQPSEEELLKALGSRVNDYLKGVEEGKHTLLNSKRWRFSSFFNRVKRRVAQNWHPDTVYKRRDPTGNVYGFRDRLTILRVRLTPKGQVKELHLEHASGVGFLDDEALTAFRSAGPFPNPPGGLVDKDTGMISFRFGFMFEIARRPSFRIFRGGN